MARYEHIPLFGGMRDLREGRGGEEAEESPTQFDCGSTPAVFPEWAGLSCPLATGTFVHECTGILGSTESSLCFHPPLRSRDLSSPLGATKVLSVCSLRASKMSVRTCERVVNPLSQLNLTQNISRK